MAGFRIERASAARPLISTAKVQRWKGGAYEAPHGARTPESSFDFMQAALEQSSALERQEQLLAKPTPD